MDWDTFKLMSNDDRLEWQFKFMDQTRWKLSGALNTITIMWAMIAMGCMAYLMIAKNYATIDLSLGECIKLALYGTVIMLACWAIEYIIAMGKFFYYNYQEKKWLKAKGYR